MKRKPSTLSLAALSSVTLVVTLFGAISQAKTVAQDSPRSLTLRTSLNARAPIQAIPLTVVGSTDAGLSAIPTVVVAAHNVSPITPRLVQVLDMKVAIPRSWTAGAPKTSFGTTNISFYGPRATLTLTHTNFQAQNLLPLAGQEPSRPEPSPYAVAALTSVDGTVTVNAEAISASAHMFSLTLTVPKSERTTARQILASWHHPRLISTTQAVHRLLNTPDRDPQVYRETFIDHRQYGWLLASGPPATAQQSWFLFATANGGKTWRLCQHTSWYGPSRHDPFLNSVGIASMKWLSTRVGLIVESSGFVDAIEVWRTKTYGRTWSMTLLKLPGMSSSSRVPNIRVEASGTISLRAYEQRIDGGAKSITWISHDHGQTWKSVVVTG